MIKRFFFSLESLKVMKFDNFLRCKRKIISLKGFISAAKGLKVRYLLFGSQRTQPLLVDGEGEALLMASVTFSVAIPCQRCVLFSNFPSLPSSMLLSIC